MDGVRGAIVVGALLATGACGGGPVLEGSAYRDRDLGWSIALPPGGAAHWTRIRVEGADLALRGSDGELLSVEVHCGGPLAPPEILARGLRIGVPDARVREQGEVMVDGRPGWAQVFDAGADGPGGLALDRARGAGADRPQGAPPASAAPDPQPVRVKTVTRVDAHCVYDFVLAARGDWPAAEADFDAWWGSFRAPPAPAGRAK